jgi:hypothetical protein
VSSKVEELQQAFDNFTKFQTQLSTEKEESVEK